MKHIVQLQGTECTVVKTECLHRVSSRGGPRSEMGSHSLWDREHMREGAVVKSGRGRSEVAGTQAKGGKTVSIALFGFDSILLLGQECRFIYMYKKAS